MSFFDAVPLIIYMAFVFTISGRIVFLKKKRVSVSTKNKNGIPCKWILFLVFALMFLLWLFEIVQPLFFKSVQILPRFLAKPLSDSVFLKLTGTFIIALSFFTWIVTLLHFKTSLRFGLNQNNKEKLITSGIFAVTRNPFFISIDIYFLGNALIFPNLFFIGFVVLTVVSIHFFILKEEKFLLKKYGKEYKKYAKKVRRYF